MGLPVVLILTVSYILDYPNYFKFIVNDILSLRCISNAFKIIVLESVTVCMWNPVILCAFLTFLHHQHSQGKKAERLSVKD